MVDYIEIYERMRYRKTERMLKEDSKLTDEQFGKLSDDKKREIIEAEKNMRKYMRRQICTHDEEYLIPLTHPRVPLKIRKSLSRLRDHDICICGRCSAVIDINVKDTLHDVDELFLSARSMLYHIQMINGDNMDDHERARVMGLHDRINRLEADLLKEYDQLLDEIPVKREW